MYGNEEDVKVASDPGICSTLQHHGSRTTLLEAQDLPPPTAQQQPRLSRGKSSFFIRRKQQTEEEHYPKLSEESVPPIPSISEEYRAYSSGQSTRPADVTRPTPRFINSFAPSDIGYTDIPNPFPPTLNNHDLNHRDTLGSSSKGTPLTLIFKNESSRHERNVSLLASSVQKHTMSLPQCIVDTPSQHREILSRPPRLSEKPCLWIEANELDQSPSYHDLSYPSPLSDEFVASRSNISTAAFLSYSQDTSRAQRIASVSEFETTSSQYLPSSTLEQGKNVSKHDEDDKVEIHTQKMTKPVQEDVIWPPSQYYTTKQFESLGTRPSRASSPSPSANSEAAERWLTQGTELHLLSHAEVPSNYSPIAVSPSPCRRQVGLRTCPQASRPPLSETDVQASARSMEATQQRPPQGDPISSRRPTPPSHEREKPLSAARDSNSSGRSSLGRASGGILRAKKSLKNLFQKNSSDTSAQWVSRPVLVPQPRPDNDIPPMPARMAFHRRGGSPPQRPDRSGIDGALLNLDSLGLARTGFPTRTRDEPREPGEKAEERREQERCRRSSRYVVEQKGEVRLPRENGDASSTTRRGMLIKDLVTGAVEFVADI